MADPKPFTPVVPVVAARHTCTTRRNVARAVMTAAVAIALVVSCIVVTTNDTREDVDTAATGSFEETGKRIFQMLEVVPDLGCDEACKYIKSRVQRAWEVGMLLFNACGAQGDEACVKDNNAMCDCEKKAGRVMCSELEYAWSTLCPNTKSLEMHKGVCEGQLITQTRDMCKKTELLPGVLVSHFPLGSAGLGKIDDNWQGLAAPMAVEAAEPAAVEGGQVDEGGVGSGFDASA
mmetsp:Transcript_70551/g.103405  ORF Transcript_70551/g.103405 Transcript_70551/m.103405 type:complete len:234 (-) Transcript_70551:117-818(-)